MAHLLLFISHREGCHKTVSRTETIMEEMSMPIEPPRKINETQIIRREEGTTMQQRKKKGETKKTAEKKETEKTGKVDIKI